jgi:thiamine biosynthesis lipoprotein
MHTFRAMNTIFFTKGLPIHSQTKSQNWFAFVERNLSRFQPGSELSMLNRSKGRLFMASALLYQVTSEADRYYRQTEGLFSPYLGAILAKLGYSLSFEALIKPVPVAEPFTSEESGLHGCPARLEPGMQSITLHQGVSVDLGGIVKGWSAHQLSLMLQKEGIRAGAIGAGGDISLWGTPKEGWTIGLADPLQEDQDLLTLRLQGTMGIATSSTVKRSWRDMSGRLHNHIIDPRSGASSDSDLIQVTVLAPSLVDAEVLAKCVLILGAEAGMKWITDKHPACAAIGVLHNGSMLQGGNMSLYNLEGGVSHERIS